MNLSFVDQGVSNSPSWIRGGAAGAAGALILSKIYFEDKSYSRATSPILGEELIDSTLFSSNSRYINSVTLAQHGQDAPCSGSRE